MMKETPLKRLLDTRHGVAHPKKGGGSVQHRLQYLELCRIGNMPGAYG